MNLKDFRTNVILRLHQIFPKHNLGRLERILLVTIADFIDWKGECSMTYHTLSESAGMSCETIKHVVRRLEEKGWLVRVWKPFKPSKFTISLSRIPDINKPIMYLPSEQNQNPPATEE